MRAHIYRIFTFFCILLLNTTFAHAQATPDAGEENLLRSNGMIGVVVGVILIILFGLIYYLWTIDKKLRKLEKENGIEG